MGGLERSPGKIVFRTASNRWLPLRVRSRQPTVSPVQIARDWIRAAAAAAVRRSELTLPGQRLALFPSTQLRLRFCPWPGRCNPAHHYGGSSCAAVGAPIGWINAPISLVMKRKWFHFEASARLRRGERQVVYSGQGKLDDEYRNNTGSFAGKDAQAKGPALQADCTSGTYGIAGGRPLTVFAGARSRWAKAEWKWLPPHSSSWASRYASSFCFRALPRWPVRATAVVRYQRSRSFGLQFLRLPVEQQSIIRYWTRSEGDLFLSAAELQAAPGFSSCGRSRGQVHGAPVLRIFQNRKTQISHAGTWLCSPLPSWWSVSWGDGGGGRRDGRHWRRRFLRKDRRSGEAKVESAE